MLTKVPDELNTLSQLMGHFEKFGDIEGIKCDKATGRATVEFRTRDAAANAIGSPEAVLNNRFIRVFWADREPAPDKHAAKAARTGAPSSDDQQQQQQQYQQRKRPAADTPNAVAKPGSNVLVVSATAAESSAVPSTAVERKAIELQKMRESIRAAQIAQQKQLLQMIARPGLTDADKAPLLTKLKELTTQVEESLAIDREAVTATATRVAEVTATAVERANASVVIANAAKLAAERGGESSSINATASQMAAMIQQGPTAAGGSDAAAVLRAQLAELEKDFVAATGVAVPATSDASADVPSYSARGGRGRGRGGASARGRGAARSMRLDNRGSSILLSGVPSELVSDESQLRAALATLGVATLKSVAAGGAGSGSVMVLFDSKHDAERAINNVNSATNAVFNARWAVSGVPSTNGTATLQSASAEDATVQETLYVGNSEHDAEGGDDERGGVGGGSVGGDDEEEGDGGENKWRR